MTNSDRMEFVREVLLRHKWAGVVYDSDIDDRIREIVDRWETDLTDTWNTAVAEGRYSESGGYK